LGPAPIPNDATHCGAALELPEFVFEALSRNSEIATLAFGAVVDGTLFGGLHCLAWDISFPTFWESAYLEDFLDYHMCFATSINCACGFLDKEQSMVGGKCADGVANYEIHS